MSPKDIASMWYGETERNVGEIFKRARHHVRRGRRAIIFVDEIEGFFTTRDRNPHEATRRALAQLMAEMDGLLDLRGVCVIGATNRPEDLDPALRRPGRFDYIVEIPLPDDAMRRAVFNVHLRNKPVVNDLGYEALVRRSSGWNGAQIELWCGAAAFEALRRTAREMHREVVSLGVEEVGSIRITQQDFDATAAAIEQRGEPQHARDPAPDPRPQRGGSSTRGVRRKRR